MSPIRIALVDDHELVRRGVAAVLDAEEDMEVAAQFSDADQAVRELADLMPDVVLMDLRMPGTSGLKATAMLHQEAPDINVLVLTVSEQAQDLQNALRFGAQGYVLKGASPEELVHAVRQVADGWVIVSPAMAGKLLGEFPDGPIGDLADEGGPKASDDLSPREWDVLNHLSNGMSNREIADSLVVSENTVKTHMRSILTKLHLKNRTQAASYARQIERG
ncbi:MAG: response regulator transcription factor [Dehalococcoidia bacterium]